MKGYARPIRERVEEKIDRTSTPDGCWPWTAGRDQNGYGMVWLDGRMVRVTRLVLAQKLGRPLGPEEHARHRCDNPPCVRPDHLLAGSRDENMRDMATRGRAARGLWNGAVLHPERVRRGQDVASARLTPEQVQQVRDRAAAGEAQRQLATAFGIAQSTVSQIVRRRAWRHVA